MDTQTNGLSLSPLTIVSNRGRPTKRISMTCTDEANSDERRSDADAVRVPSSCYADTMIFFRRLRPLSTTASLRYSHHRARVLVVGSGRMGQIRASLLQANPRFDVQGVVDTHFDGARQLADKYGWKAYESLEAAISSQSPLDGIVVSTPTFSHPSIIRRAADAEIAVFTEKPVAETAEEIEVTFQYASSIAVCCGFQRRFDPSYVAAKQNLIQIGKPMYAQIVFRDHPCPPREFLLSGGNIFMDLSAHDVDFITDALQDRVVSVYATGNSSDAELEANGIHDSATMLMRMSKGTTVTLFMSRFAAYGYDQRCEIFGSDGSVSVDNIREHSAVVATASGIQQACLQHSFPERFHNAFGLELDAFADTILDGVRYPVSSEECVHVQKVADAALLSCQTGTVIEL